MSSFANIQSALGKFNGTVHVHMTNTAITDPEILELRYPVRCLRFSMRQGSGGPGRWQGGNGLIREFEFLRPLQVSLLTQNRLKAAPGGAGGGPGLPGKQTLFSADSGSSTELPGCVSMKVQSGDRICIETPGGGGWGA